MFNCTLCLYKFSLDLLPSPVITVKSISDSLRVSVGFLEDSDFLEDSLIYEVIFWENTSNIEVKRLCSIIL
jgi:hypothetical protein